MINGKIYPYISAVEKPYDWEFYFTVKPSRRVYLKGISKAKLAKLRKRTAETGYLERLRALNNGFGASTRAEYARTFYKKVFGRKGITTRIP